MTEELTKIPYKDKMVIMQKMLEEQAEKLAKSKRALITVFEGHDASGKSGCIRRLTRRLDAKQYSVVPISKPSEEEAKYHYLKRFWTTLPQRGKIVFYDRSWYGRVLVERIEGFCTECEWKRAYREINEFERMLRDDGSIIVKIWLDVSEEEQLRRFHARLEDPAKSHKITDEDWRNRSKRPEYDLARDEMMELTSTAAAPWNLIEADDKKYARLTSAGIILDILEREL